jgi:hypothetical protein
MTMTSYFSYFLAVYALVFILQHKALFLRGKLQLLDDTLDCAFCLGFWVGLAFWTPARWLEGPPTWGPLWGSLWQMEAHALVWALGCAVGCLFMSQILEGLSRE